MGQITYPPNTIVGPAVVTAPALGQVALTVNGASDGLSSAMVINNGPLVVNAPAAAVDTVTVNTSGAFGLRIIQGAAASGAALFLQGGPSGGTTSRIRYVSNAAANNNFAIRDDSSAVDRVLIDPNGRVTITAATAGDTLRVGPSPGSGALIATSAALTDGVGASAGTLTNAPSAGNPTKWIKINDNGTIRAVPAW